MTDAFTPPQQPTRPPKRPAGDEQIRVIAVEVRGQGGVTSSATLQIASLTDRARFKRATKTSAILFGLAVATLPIPPIHWVLVPAFLDGQIACPKCQGSFELESQPPSWPLDLTCHKCKAQLTVAPLP